VSSLYFGKLLVGGGDLLLETLLSLGTTGTQLGPGRSLQAIRVGLETPSWRAIREKLRPAIRRRRNSCEWQWNA